jgi:ABC-type sugar transport system ATPase subunit
MTGIRKAFPGVRALDGVDLELAAGEVHVLLGENGAGKSTLIKVLGGAVARDAGTISIDGVPAPIATPRQARDAGIAVIHQELMLVPELSVAENIHLGRMPQRAGLVDRRAMAAESDRLMALLGMTIDPWRRVATLRVAQQQLVEIARALSLDARIVVMDEPTSALTDRETARLFTVIRELTARGVSVVYISHRLEEIFAIGDRVTVMRDGRSIETRPLAGADRRALVRLMADRDIDEGAARTRDGSAADGSTVDGTAADRPVRLEVAGLSRAGALHDVSFTVRAGEIVGLAGLLGAGRTEVARAIFGLDPFDVGHVLVDGVPVTIRSPRDAIAAGIGFVTEDRAREGLVLDRSVRDNVALPVLRRLSRLGVVRRAQERAVATQAVQTLRIRTPDLAQPVRALSGGNQQKVVLAKWLATGARVLMLDEPTRGIDVGAKQEIHRLVEQLAADGAAILVISSDLPELLALADRILVMRDGRIADACDRTVATPERLMASAVGA